QSAVEILLLHKALDVVRLDAATIQNANGFGGIRAESFLDLGTDQPVRIRRDVGSGGVSGANRPYGLVGNYYFRELLFGKSGQAARELLDQNLLRFSGFSLFQLFTYADDRRKTGFEGRLGFLQNIGIGFESIEPPLAMPDENPFASRRRQHSGRNFAGVRALFSPVHVLPPHFDFRAGGSALCRGNVDKWREDHDVAFVNSVNKRIESLKEFDRLLDGFVHLPVPRHDASSHKGL